MHNLRDSLVFKRDKLVFSLHDQLSDQIDILVPEGGIHIWCKVKADANEQQLLKEALYMYLEEFSAHRKGMFDLHSDEFRKSKLNRPFLVLQTPYAVLYMNPNAKRKRKTNAANCPEVP